VPKRPDNSAIAFGIKALAFYVLLVFPWPGAVELYSSAFRGIANAALTDTFTGARVRFDPMETPVGTLNTKLTLTNRETRAFVRKDVTPWRAAYLPTATIIALLLALPVSFRKSAILTAWGFIAIHGFLIARVLILIANGLNGPGPAATLTLGPTASRALANANSIFVETTTVTFIVPAMIWMVVTMAAGVWPFAARPRRPDHVSPNRPS